VTVNLPPIEQTTLGNGLRVLAVRVPSVSLSVAEIVTLAGSRFDPPELGGISHFLEHMLYRGTPTHPGPHELSLAFEELGGSLEAATYVDRGSIVLEVPGENLLSSLPHLFEVYRHPLLNGIAIERDIVREEILETLDEAGQLIDADEVSRRAAFGDHPLGRPIAGTVDALERFERSRLAEHHRRCYVGAATVLCVAGPLDPAQVLQFVEAGLESVARGLVQPASPPEPAAAPRFDFVAHVDSQTAVRLALRAPGANEPLEAATELLLHVLDDGMSTRLYHRICNTLGLCYDVGAYYETWGDVGIVEVWAEAAHERAEQLVDEIISVVLNLRDQPPSPEEIDRAKKRARWQLMQLLDEPGEIASFYGHAELTATAANPHERALQIEAVTQADLRAAAEELLRPSQISLSCVGQQSRRSRDRLCRSLERFG